MNFLDVLIIIFTIGAFFRGLEIGFVRQFFSGLGFIGGLWLGSLLQPHLIGLANSDGSRSILTLVITLGSAIIFLTIGEFIGIAIKRKMMPHSVNPIDYGFGGVLAVIVWLLAVWLSAAIVLSLPYPSAQAAVNNSSIIKYLNRTLPSAPNVVANIGNLIDPNGFPDVFAGIEPTPSQTVPQPGLEGFQTAIAATQPSVVRILGQGCGGVVEGSGFVVDTNLVATNAHVVAGIDRPIIQDQNGSHSSQAIWFDPNLDFALLRTSNLAGDPLKFETKNNVVGDDAAVLGYPGGGGFEANSAAILDSYNAIGFDIYGQQKTKRAVYELQADIIPGNSGGPVISQRGKVIGVVFAESATYKNIGYALTLDQVLPSIQTAQQQNHVRDMSTCAQ